MAGTLPVDRVAVRTAPSATIGRVTPAELPDPAERAFYVEEFAGSTIVAGIVAHDAEVLTSLARAAASLDEGAARNDAPGH